MPVYFLLDEAAGLIKIGQSGHIQSRKRHIQYSLGRPRRPLRIIATIEGNLRQEGLLHNLFRDQHSHGEWFHCCPAIDDAVSAINAGTFDFGSLPDEPSWLRCEQARGVWVVRRAKASLRAVA